MSGPRPRTPPPWMPSRGAVVALGAGAIGALAYVDLVDPHQSRSFYPRCPFRWLTGWNCPCCGGLRMTHDLLHGELAAAVNDNILLLVGLPALLVWLALSWYRGRRPMTPINIAVIVSTLVLWTVLRNLPGFPLIPQTFG